MAGVSLGAAGEVLAARFLRRKGYTMMAANYRCRHGEVDIIAADETHIAFVEVKTRRQGSLYTPREAVTHQKQRRLLSTVSQYLSVYPSNLQPRFDVIEVVTDPNNPLRAVEINHIMGAFEAGDLHRAF